MIIDKKIHEVEISNLDKVNKVFLSHDLNNDILIIDKSLNSNKYLKKVTESTQGNLSVQLKKLKEEKYIEIEKTFRNNYPKTSCSITENGRIQFEEFFKNLIKMKNS